MANIVDVQWQNLVLLLLYNKNVLETQLMKYPPSKNEKSTSILKVENSFVLIHCVFAYGTNMHIGVVAIK